MRKQVVVRLVVEVPDAMAGAGARRDEESAARRYVADLMRMLPAGMLVDFEVVRVERAQPGKALWSE